MRVIHVCQSVRGALMNWRDEEWQDCCTDLATGRTLTPREVKEAFLDELSKGHEVIPFGEPCEGFDYSGGGCPGHESEEPES